MNKQHVPSDTELLDALQAAGERFRGDGEEAGWVCTIHKSGEVELLQDPCTDKTVRKALAAGLGLTTGKD